MLLLLRARRLLSAKMQYGDLRKICFDFDIAIEKWMMTAEETHKTITNTYQSVAMTQLTDQSWPSPSGK